MGCRFDTTPSVMAGLVPAIHAAPSLDGFAGVRRLDDVRLAVMMLDGLELKGRMMIVALGITTEGVKIPLGLWEGSTENATVATSLLSDLVERGLDPEQGMLFVIDGAKALRKAIRSVFGEVPVQRCIRHKERNVLEHLPERDRPLLFAQRLPRRRGGIEAFPIGRHPGRDVGGPTQPAERLRHHGPVVRQAGCTVLRRRRREEAQGVVKQLCLHASQYVGR